MNKPSGHYVITSTVAEESVRAFVPNALPPGTTGDGASRTARTSTGSSGCTRQA